MGKFSREIVEAVVRIKRVTDDIGVIAGGAATTLEPFTVMAQDTSDGKFYPWAPGVPARSLVAGIYTGDTLEITAGEDLRINLSTACYIGATDLVGVDFETQFTALSELKRAGVFVVEKIEGTEEY